MGSSRSRENTQTANRQERLNQITLERALEVKQTHLTGYSDLKPLNNIEEIIYYIHVLHFL